MYNMNLNQNKIYKIHYHLNGIEYFSFSKLAGKEVLRDIITDNIYKFENISSISYEDINPKIIKYFFKLYKKENNINIFKYYDYIDQNLHLYVDVLRFFNLKYEDLIQNNKNVNIINYIINKCKKYLKKYFDSYFIEEYITNLNTFSDINYILSYKPNEILNKNNQDKFFWSDKFISFQKSEYILFNLPNETFKSFKCPLELDINVFISDKQKHKTHIQNSKLNYLNNLEKEYKEEIIKIITEKIKEGKNTLEKEKDFAQKTKDDDLIFEIDIITEKLLELENTIFNKIENSLFLDTNLFEFWPDLLYPIPNIHNDPYFFNNKTLNNIDFILSKI